MTLGVPTLWQSGRSFFEDLGNFYIIFRTCVFGDLHIIIYHKFKSAIGKLKYRSVIRVVNTEIVWYAIFMLKLLI